MSHRSRSFGFPPILGIMLTVVLVSVFAFACGGTETIVKEVEVPGETVVVEKEVIKTIEVPGETVVKEVIKTVEVPGETVVKEVVKTVEVPGETVVKEVIKTVEVPGETVVKEVVKTVEVVKEVVVEAERPMVRPVPGEVLVILAKDVGPPGWHRPITPAPYYQIPTMLGLSEHLVDVTTDGSLTPMIARKWEIDEVGITWTIHPGVPWHDPAYGTVDVDDIQWTYENGSREGTVNHFTGWYREDYQNQRIIDNNTIKWDWGPNGPTLRYILTTRNFGTGTPIENKDYYEAVGEDVHSVNWMGTGPYKVTSHVADDIITIEAVPNHWRNTADFELVRALEVPEQATRIALMKSGQGDITDIAISLLDQLVDEPGVRLVQGAVAQKFSGTFFMGGNWQIQTLMSGEPNTPAHVDNPWVGDPNDPDDLERARNVRRALSYAIDRKSINDFILFGQGCLTWVYITDSCSPRWQERWEHPYDPAMARELLALGGYPDGFEMPLWIPTGAPPDTFIEVVEAVVPMWTEIGIDVNIDKSAYASRRPELFREEPMLRDVAAFPWGGEIELVQFTDYLCDLIDTCTKWNSGYDHPAGYDIHKNFSVHYSDPAAAWDALVPYFDLHSHEGELPVINTVDWLDPLVVGARIGSVDMVEHSLGIPDIQGLHIAR